MAIELHLYYTYSLSFKTPKIITQEVCYYNLNSIK